MNNSHQNCILAVLVVIALVVISIVIATYDTEL